MLPGETEFNKKKIIVGYTFVVCDLIHVGHVKLFEKCREQCDILFVGVLTDEVVETYKRKPIIPIEQRLKMVESIRYVKGVIEVYELDQTRMIEKIKPDVFFYAGQVDVSRAVKALEKMGGKYIRIPRTPNISSTQIIKDCQGRT